MTIKPPKPIITVFTDCATDHCPGHHGLGGTCNSEGGDTLNGVPEHAQFFQAEDEPHSQAVRTWLIEHGWKVMARVPDRTRPGLWAVAAVPDHPREKLLADALARMLSLYRLMMEGANHARFSWSTECLREMNTAPFQAEAAIRGETWEP